MNIPLSVLLVEDSDDDAQLILDELRKGDYDLRHARVDNLSDFRNALNEQLWQLVIVDYSMPTFNGLEALKVVQELELDLPFLLVSSAIGEDLAVEAIKAGAHDYVMKDDLARLVPAIHRELQEAAERHARRSADKELRSKAEQLAGLHQASMTISERHDMDSLVLTIIEQAIQLMHTSGAGVSLCDPLKQEIKIYEELDSDGRSYRGMTLKYGEGAAGIVAQTGKPLIIDDYRAWSHRSAIYEQNKPFTATLSVPMTWHGQVTGVLQVTDDTETRRFTSEDAELLSLLGDQAATAIENARLFEAEEKRAAELMALRQASLSVTASLELESVLYVVLESALHFMPGSVFASIFLYDEGHDELKFGAALNADGSRGKLLTKIRPKGLSYTVATTGQPMVMDHLTTHPSFDNYRPQGSVAAVGIPLKIGQRVLGVMDITHPHPRRYTQSELHILSLLGDQAAIAIENARLFQRAETERRHLGLLYDLGGSLATSLQHEDILSQAVTLTCQALDGLAGEAFIYEPEHDQLKVGAVHGLSLAQQHELEHVVKKSWKITMAGWVAINRTALVCPDIDRDPRWLAVPELDGYAKSAILAPIMDNERLIGVLSVTHRQADAFSEDHLDLLQAICHQVALALSNAESYAQVENLVEMLAAEQQRLESLVELLPIGVLVLDNDFNLLVANLLARQIITRLNPEYKDSVVTHLGPYAIENLCKEYVSSHPADRLPIEITNTGQPRMVVEAEARLIGGEARQWVITLRDVTQEREIQERVRLQDRLATVGQLAAGIAHDFNNIMAAILVYTDLLMGDRGLPSVSRDRLTIIQQQVQRASSLIRQILDFSRRSMMEQHPLDLLPFVKELDKLLSRVLPETIHLELKYQPGIYMVIGDPTRLQQAFMNLALNARDAMPDGGSLYFELSHFHHATSSWQQHSGLPDGDWICISVKDSGRGISPEVLPYIFDPFFTTKPVGQGTGLGLAQVYGIIRQHQGYIDVSSQDEQGTEFKIYLPAQAPLDEGTIEETAQLRIEGGGRKILVVEDDPATREAIKVLLEAQDFKVLTANTGQEAYQLYEVFNKSILMVVSDVVMPEMGGVALYQALRSRWPKTRILFITGHPLESENQALLETGGVHWLQKPFSVQEFISTVQIVLEE